MLTKSPAFTQCKQADLAPWRVERRKKQNPDRAEYCLACGYACIYRQWSIYAKDFIEVQFGPMYAEEAEALQSAQHCANWKQSPVRVEFWKQGTGGGGRYERLIAIVRPQR